jgi:hypothetical membrane protein
VSDHRGRGPDLHTVPRWETGAKWHRNVARFSSSGQHTHTWRRVAMTRTAPVPTLPAMPVPRGSTARRLALGAVIGPLLFTLTWLVLGFVSPGYTIWDTRIAPYSPISQPISGLGMGVTGPYMNAAFILCGLLLVIGVTGSFAAINQGRATPRTLSAVLLALSGLGMVIVGVFDLEAIMPHLLGVLLALATPVLGFLVAGLFLRGLPRWRRFGTWLLLGSPLTLLLLVLFFATFDPTAAGANHGVSGLVQRVLAVEVHAWFVALGWLAFRRSTHG